MSNAAAIKQFTLSNQHTIVQSIIWHFLPGILMLIAYLWLAPVVIESGLPSTYALLLVEVLVLAPYGLGHLYYHGWKENGRLSLTGIVLLRNSVPIRQYLILVPVSVIAALAVHVLMAPLDLWLKETTFFWLPDWFFYTDYSVYSKTVMVAMFSLGILIDGVLGPLVEELYFRGYLLPRLAQWGRWAILINASLFAIYHFWQPMSYPSLLVISLIITGVAWWKQSVRLAIYAHCGLNMLGHVIGLTMVLAS